MEQKDKVMKVEIAANPIDEAVLDGDIEVVAVSPEEVQDGGDEIRIRDGNGGVFIASRSRNLVTWRAEGDDRHPETVRVCSFIEVSSRLTAVDGEGCWAEVRFGGVTAKVSLNPREILGEAGDLVNKGLVLYLPASRKPSLLADYIQAAANSCPDRVGLVRREGWVGDDMAAYAMDGEIITGRDTGRCPLRILTNAETSRKEGRPVVSEVKGTLEEWRSHLGVYIFWSRAAALAICTALAGCLVRFLGARINPIIHINGAPGCGKSTMGRLACSVWGSDMNSCNGALVGTQLLAENYSDSCLVLDEVAGDANGAIVRSIYSIANGRTRVASNSEHRIMPVRDFSLSLITTGESSFSDVSLDVRKRMTTGGEEARIIGYRVGRAGSGNAIFHDLPAGMTEADAFADIHRWCSLVHGVAGECFVRGLAGEGRKAIEADFREFVTKWTGMFLKGQDDDRPDRAAARRERQSFEVIAYTGYKAQSWGILPGRIGPDGRELDRDDPGCFWVEAEIAECAAYCAKRDTSLASRLEECVSEIVAIPPEAAYCYSSSSPGARTALPANPAQAACTALIFDEDFLGRGGEAGSPIFGGTRAVAVLTRRQLSKIARNNGCGAADLCDYLNTRGYTWRGRCDCQFRPGYSCYGLSHSGRYAVILLRAADRGTPMTEEESDAVSRLMRVTRV